MMSQDQLEYACERILVLEEELAFKNKAIEQLITLSTSAMKLVAEFADLVDKSDFPPEALAMMEQAKKMIATLPSKPLP